MGIILGPVVIAVGIAMSKTWLSVSATVNDKDQPTAKTETVLKKLSKNSIESDIVSDAPENREALTTIITASLRMTDKNRERCFFMTEDFGFFDDSCF